MPRALALLFVLRCWCTGAQRCASPPGWYINGVSPSGSYRVAPVLGRAADDLVDARARRAIAGPSEIRGRLRCAGGSTPRQDGLSVWCQR